MRHLPDDVFFAFRNVISAAYELHDKLLGRLLELAGADAHVLIVSDHGFLSGLAQHNRSGRTRPRGRRATSG